MDRRYELEVLRRSLVMLTPGAGALTREQALELLEQLQEAERRLSSLRDRLRRLVEELDQGAAG